MRSWNTHALITRAALDAVDVPQLGDSVPVIPLEAFLSATKEPLRDILKWYHELLDRKVHGSASRKEVIAGHPEAILTTGDFLAALRLSTSRSLHYVRVLRPDEIEPNTQHDPSRDGPPGGMYVETAIQEGIQVREILCTFSDQPDWGMDQDLFSVPSYDYGTSPFGPGRGASSQAPFHMAFLHEHPLVVGLRPSLGRSFMGERVQLFFALARLALDSGIDYWGWRFAAWAMHYLQDITQPYHAKPFPAARLPLLLRFVLHPNPKKFAAKNENYLKNRHILFEAGVHFLLNEAVKKRADHPFLRALGVKISERELGSRSARPIESNIGMDRLLKRSSQVAARLARQIDQTMIALMKDRRISDPGYSLNEDRTYRIEETLPAAGEERPDLLDAFTRLVSECLAVTGDVSRYAVRAAAGSS